MTTQKLDTDYLIIGAGAMGLAFADELIRQDKQARCIIVDKRAKPGGHWNDAYPFVSLHQPAAYYGVNSKKLGEGGADLASGDQVLFYFEQVMKDLEATGRVAFFPMCEYQGEARFSSMIAAGLDYKVDVRRKVVDSTYMNVEVPSTTPPKYDVAPGVNLIPPNELTSIDQPKGSYIVIGAGKTGIDAILFLLAKGVNADDVQWVMPNDCWLLERSDLQPGKAISLFSKVYESFIHSSSVDDLFRTFESNGTLFRLNKNIWPTKFRCATVSEQERAQLRKVKNVVRKGRIRRIEEGRVVLDGAFLLTATDAVYVDCTANPLSKRPVKPIFDGNLITLQSVSVCQQVFSAALIACVECKFADDTAKNALCLPVPHPETNEDYVLSAYYATKNLIAWERPLGAWLRKSRLFAMHHESLFDQIIGGLRLKRKLKPAIEQMRMLIEAEPGPFSNGFPSDSTSTSHAFQTVT